MTKEQYLAERKDLTDTLRIVQNKIDNLDFKWISEAPYQEGDLVWFEDRDPIRLQEFSHKIRAVVLGVHIHGDKGEITYDLYCRGGVERFIPESKLSPREHE